MFREDSLPFIVGHGVKVFYYFLNIDFFTINLFFLSVVCVCVFLLHTTECTRSQIIIINELYENGQDYI